MREGVKEGRKEETPNSSADRTDKREEMMRAHASSCQTPLPCLDSRYKLEASLLLFLLLIRGLMLRSLGQCSPPDLQCLGNNKVVLLNQTSDIS